MRPIGWLLVLALGAAALGGLRYFDQHPLEIEGAPPDREVTGRPPKPYDRGDVAILIDRAAIARAAQPRSFAAVDFSCAWINLLGAELGPHALVEAADADLGKYRAVVVTASAHRAIAPAKLQAFVERGGVALIDGPGSPEDWPAPLFSLAGLTRTGSRAFPEARLLPGGSITDEDLLAFDEVRFTRPETIAAVEATPDVVRRSTLFFERAIGAGRVVATPAPIARLYTLMLQGSPAADDFTLAPRFGDYEDILEPDDLVTDASLRENEVPFADLLARAVVGLLDPDDAPLPRLLWFPADSDGVFLMTHDEDLRGGAKSLWLTEWDARLGLRGTTFVISHPRLFEDWRTDDDRRPFHQRKDEAPDDDYAARIADVGGAVGLHWNQYPMPWGIGPIEPVQLQFSCERQAKQLRDLSRATARLRTNRNHYLIQRERWTGMFRVLAANGVRLDSTFGANKGRGYLFGTARPYAILDENGFPLPIRELPFVNQEDWGGADAAYFDRLLAANAERHKGAIVSLFHPHLVILEEDGAALFEHVATRALATGHRPWNFEEALDFFVAREEAVVRSWREDGDLRIDANVARGDLALALPSGSGRRVASRLGGQEVPVDRVRIGARTYDRLKIPEGQSRIVVKTEP